MALHQELLVNSLRQELNYFSENRDNCKRDLYRTESEMGFTATDHHRRTTAYNQEHEILKAQYDELQFEYSRLFQEQYSREKENCGLPGRIYTGKRDREDWGDAKNR